MNNIKYILLHVKDDDSFYFLPPKNMKGQTIKAKFLVGIIEEFLEGEEKEQAIEGLDFISSLGVKIASGGGSEDGSLNEEDVVAIKKFFKDYKHFGLDEKDMTEIEFLHYRKKSHESHD